MSCITPFLFTNLVDFQGHVMDNSFGGLAASNPVIGQFFLAGDANQEVWNFKSNAMNAADYRNSD
jgi:hypothetical protein